MSKADARISRVNNSWRVRVHGHPPRFFADSDYGGKAAAKAAARAWRDSVWDGSTPGVKLTAAERRAIRNSKGHYKDVAEQYGVAPSYIHELRRGKRG